MYYKHIIYNNVIFITYFAFVIFILIVILIYIKITL